MLWENKENASNTKIFSNNAFYVHELYMSDLYRDFDYPSESECKQC